MNTTTKAEREVFVIMDGVERGPYTVSSFVQSVRDGTHGAECIWRFADGPEYKGINDVPFEEMDQPIPVPSPKKPKSISTGVLVLAFCVFTIAVVAGVIGVFALAHAKANQELSERAAIQQEVQQQTVAFLNSSASAPRFSAAGRNRYLIEGSITNSTGRSLALVSVEFSIFDSNGNRIQSATDSVGSFEPFEVWAYKIPVHHDGGGLQCSLKQIEVIP